MLKRVVIIDTGIDLTHPVFGDMESYEQLTVCGDREGEYRVKQGEAKDEIGHGTAVMGILKKECPNNTEFTIIKLFDHTHKVTPQKLAYTLEYIDSHISCAIIHMSLGCITPDKQLRLICERLYQKDVLMVAAFSNDGSMSFPAAYPQVIGVDVSMDVQNKNDYFVVENSPVNIIALGTNHRLAWTNPRYIIHQGASFSAPYITARLVRLLEEGFLPQRCVQKLMEEGKRTIGSQTVEKRTCIDIIEGKRLAIFPYNKENHTLTNFAGLLRGQITKVYDHKLFRTCGKKICSFDGRDEFVVESIEHIDWDAFDCLILGHLEQMQKILGEQLKEKLLEQCLKHKKHVFCYDNKGVNEYEMKFRRAGLLLAYPGTGRDVPQKGGRLYQIQAPVVGIMGTSNQQCKFTLQLLLRQELLRRGYIVGQMGTEPSSALFGLDETIHFGYSGTVQDSGEKFVENINFKMHCIDEKEPDLILAGNQAGTIARYAFNIAHLRIPELEFLLGVNPDIVVLCVNAYDDIAYIKRSIQAIESVIATKVVALAISPLIYPNDWYLMNEKKVLAEEKQLDETIEKLVVELNLPAFAILPGENAERLVNLLIACLCK